MNVTLVYPPNRNLPSSPYGALPLLAGCLGAAGHRVRVVDANLEVFDRLIQPSTLERAREDFERMWGYLRAKPSLTPTELGHLQGLAELSVVPFERLMGAERAAAVLRDPELFANPEQVNWAYDTLANVNRAMYSMNPLFYLLKPGTIDEFFAYLESDFNNPVKQLVDDHAIEAILATEPELVGVCVPFNEQFVEAFSLLKELKRRAPHVKTIVGGAIITAYAEKLCNDERFYAYADFGMPGEADQAFPEFVTALEQGGDLDQVSNLFRMEDGQILTPLKRSLPNLNEIAAPDFSDIQVGRYLLPEPVVNYQTSRGCYYGKCTFCSFDIKQNFRLRKPELVTADLERIYEQTGAKHVIFWDPLTPPKLMKAVSEWNLERPEADRIFWGAETKFEKFFQRKDYTDLLYAGGARFLQFGYESGSQRLLDLMVKGNDLEQVDSMMNTLRDSGIKVSVQWFIGFPHETEDEARESFRFLDTHRDSVLLSSYMGTFTLSPDDDIFRTNGDLYDVDIFQHADGSYDFKYRKPPYEHYDRDELDAAYLARGDSESVTRMAFFVYLTRHPERAHEIASFHRVGVLPDRFEEIAEGRPTLPDYNFLRTWDFDVFTPAAEQGVGPEGAPLPGRDSHAVFCTLSQRIYPLSERDVSLLRRADGTRTADELVAELPGDPGQNRARVLDLVRRGVLRIPLRARVGAAVGE